MWKTTAALLLVFFLDLTKGDTSTDVEKGGPRPFWISVELEQIVWKKDCLTTATCDRARFKIFEHIGALQEQTSMSFLVSPQLVEDSRPFISHWTAGSSEAFALSCQVVGYAHVFYEIPNVCDETQTVRPFEDSKKGIADGGKSSSRQEDRQGNELDEDEDEDKRRLEVSGKCFNATLTLTRHLKRCPWCERPKKVAASQDGGGWSLFSDSQSASAAVAFWRAGGLGTSSWLLWALGALALLSLASTLSFGCLLLAWLRIRKRVRQAKRASRQNAAFSGSSISGDVRREQQQHTFKKTTLVRLPECGGGGADADSCYDVVPDVSWAQRNAAALGLFYGPPSSVSPPTASTPYECCRHHVLSSTPLPPRTCPPPPLVAAALDFQQNQQPHFLYQTALMSTSTAPPPPPPPSLPAPNSTSSSQHQQQQQQLHNDSGHESI